MLRHLKSARKQLILHVTRSNKSKIGANLQLAFSSWSEMCEVPRTYGVGLVKGKPLVAQVRRWFAGEPGSGAGKGGGAGGSVRESGGALGRLGAANEDGYFFNKEREQLEKMKKKLKTEREEKVEIKRKEDD